MDGWMDGWERECECYATARYVRSTVVSWYGVVGLSVCRVSCVIRSFVSCRSLREGGREGDDTVGVPKPPCTPSSWHFSLRGGGQLGSSTASSIL